MDRLQVDAGGMRAGGRHAVEGGGGGGGGCGGVDGGGHELLDGAEGRENFLLARLDALKPAFHIFMLDFDKGADCLEQFVRVGVKRRKGNGEAAGVVRHHGVT